MFRSRSLNTVTGAAVLAAMSIVFGKLLAINIGDTIRMSFENLPIMLCSFVFGPITGGICGVCADLVGCLIRGYAINPILTAAQFLMGFIPGALVLYVFRSRRAAPVCISVVATHILCSLIIKTVGLCIFYHNPFLPLLGTRTLSYLPVAAAESYICVLLTKHSFIKGKTPRKGAKKIKQ